VRFTRRQRDLQVRCRTQAMVASGAIVEGWEHTYENDTHIRGSSLNGGCTSVTHPITSGTTARFQADPGPARGGNFSKTRKSTVGPNVVEHGVAARREDLHRRHGRPPCPAFAAPMFAGRGPSTIPEDQRAVPTSDIVSAPRLLGLLNEHSMSYILFLAAGTLPKCPVASGHCATMLKHGLHPLRFAV